MRNILQRKATYCNAGWESNDLPCSVEKDQCACMRACVRACEHACVRVSVRANVRACVCACVHTKGLEESRGKGKEGRKGRVGLKGCGRGVKGVK